VVELDELDIDDVCELEVRDDDDEEVELRADDEEDDVDIVDEEVEEEEEVEEDFKDRPAYAPTRIITMTTITIPIFATFEIARFNPI